MRRMHFAGLKFVLFAIVAIAVVGVVVSALWNALMPAIFGLPAIGFWQAIGLFILGRLLFGRLGGRGSRFGRARFVRGWNSLTPEERERFRRAMGRDCPRRFAEDPPPGEPAPGQPA